MAGRFGQRIRQLGQKRPIRPNRGVYLLQISGQRGYFPGSPSFKARISNHPRRRDNSQLVSMNKEILPANNSKIGENLPISVRSILQKLKAFFRFTEDDAFALLSAYGLSVFEVNRLQDNRPNKQKARSRNFDDSCRRNSNDCFPGPVPIGVHPDITRAKRTKGSQNHADR